MNPENKHIVQLIEAYLNDPEKRPEQLSTRSLTEIMHEFSNLYTEIRLQNEELRRTMGTKTKCTSVNLIFADQQLNY
ncbi:MAG: hypothetical protein IPM52_13370 [Bacteroidetes bacterium]|nr:hypothetical protein [Bacteroidota bacterium]